MDLWINLSPWIAKLVARDVCFSMHVLLSCMAVIGKFMVFHKQCLYSFFFFFLCEVLD